LAAKNKCLADSNKPRTSAKPTDAAGGLLITFAEWLQPLRRPERGKLPPPSPRVRWLSRPTNRRESLVRRATACGIVSVDLPPSGQALMRWLSPAPAGLFRASVSPAPLCNHSAARCWVGGFAAFWGLLGNGTGRVQGPSADR